MSDILFNIQASIFSYLYNDPLMQPAIAIPDIFKQNKDLQEQDSPFQRRNVSVSELHGPSKVLWGASTKKQKKTPFNCSQ